MSIIEKVWQANHIALVSASLAIKVRFTKVKHDHI